MSRMTDLPVLNAPPPAATSGKRTLAPRRITRRIRLGSVAIGGGAPVTVQSMTKTETADVEATLWQIRDMIMAGCEIVRVTANTIDAADVFDRLVAGSSVPVIADVHFDYRCAIRVMERGVTGLRINPGNIGARWKVSCVTPSRPYVEPRIFTRNRLCRTSRPRPRRRRCGWRWKVDSGLLIVDSPASTAGLPGNRA